MAARTPWKYTPLTGKKSFRLIDLLPGERHHPLHCRIYEEDLENHPPYEAVSYVWGDRSQPVDLNCNKGEVLQITRNLAATLRCIRHTTEKRTVWADSVCINQNKDKEAKAERSQQVRQMGTIYESATRVLIWLGREDSPTALHTLRLGLRAFAPLRYEGAQLRERARQAYNLDLHWQKGDLHYEAIREEFGLPPIASETFRSVQGLLRRDWFDRAWTYQESRLAKERHFFIGDELFEESELVDAVLALVLLSTVFKTPTFIERSSVAEMFRAREPRGVSHDPDEPPINQLGALLLSRRGAGCTEPKDIVYSLLGVNINNTAIEPIYEDKTDEQVFIDATLDVIRQEGNLDVLKGKLQHTSPQNENALPSWVPDWSSSVTNFAQVFQGYQHHRFSATGTSKPVCAISNHRQLDILGLKIDTIRTLKPAHEGDVETFLRHETAAIQDEHGFWMYNDTEHLSHALLRIRCTDLAFLDSENPFARWSGATNTIAERWYNHDDGPESNVNHPDIGDFRMFIGRIMNHTYDRRIMVTTGRRIGIAPSNAQPGDIVALLFGGRVPVLLRAFEGNYHFLGECFLDGVMDGEAFEQAAEFDRDHDFGEDWRERFANGNGGQEGGPTVFTLI